MNISNKIMTFKILMFIFVLIVAEILRLLREGIAGHRMALGILKILILNTAFLAILSIKSFYLGIVLRIKKVVPEIIKTAAKALSTPLKTPKKEN